MKSTHLLLILFIFPISGFSQSYKFRRFNEQDGLSNKFVYSIEQDNSGYVLVGTGEGLYRYDGFNFKQFTTADGLSEDFITCSLKEKNGSIWYGHGNGFISVYHSGKFEKIDLTHLTTSRINQIFADSQNNIWAVTQNDGLLSRTSEGKWVKIHKGIEEFALYSFYKNGDNELWIGTDMGLLKGAIQADSSIAYDFVGDIIETKVSSIVSGKNVLTIGTEDSGIYLADLRNGGSVSTLTVDTTDFKKYNINSIYEDNESNLWVSTNNKGLILINAPLNGRYLGMTEYNSGGNYSSTSVKTSFRDREGNLWLGSIGEGLLKLENEYFAIFNTHIQSIDPYVFSVYEKNDTIWSGYNGHISVSLNHLDNIILNYDQKDGLPQGEIRSIYTDPAGRLWAGTSENGLFLLNPKNKKFESLFLAEDNLSRTINDIVGLNDMLYVATDFGVYQLKDKKVVYHLSIQSGLTHNVVKTLFKDSHGRIWIGTHDNQVTYIEDGIIQTIESSVSGIMLENKCITEDNDGNIWIGTEGSGIFKLSETEPLVFDKQSGLYSDYCYSLICDNRNNLWIGHRGALSRINLKTKSVEIIDPGTGFEFNFLDNSVDVFPNGVLIFGTNKGVLRYEPDKDKKNEVEPILNFDKIFIAEKFFNANEQINLKSGEYKLEIGFIGISLTKSEKVTYQYILEGYDSDWSAPNTGRTIAYNKLGPGEYTFKVKCFNADGFGGNTILEFKIFIDTPFWQKWWFIAICVIAIVLMVRFIIIRREKILKENQEYLKKALNEATREVIEQKEMLEVKNKDITDSILYAKNIQKAMLPNYDSLSRYFTDAFVYFKPRDIVSGDFYWVEKFENDIVVSCADCTGHGVPGAFMSLIGTTLLKEVSRDKSVQCARQVLERLDENLNQMLNKRGSEFGVEDGMDIAVFNYNFSKQRIMVSSANRPVLLRIKGEWIEIKGERLSIGGSNSNIKKTFEQHEFDVAPGDLIYMFSDGITDQFGGAEGKKLKRSGLIKSIKEYSELPMTEQRMKLREMFYNWKGDHPQIDDIIIMGIRF